MLTNLLLYAGLVPLVASVLVAVVMRQLRAPLKVIWPTSIAIGFLAALLAVRGQVGIAESVDRLLQPHEALDWLPHIVFLALGACLVPALPQAHRSRWIALIAVLCLAVPVRLLSGNLAQQWSVFGKLFVVTSVAVALALVWLSLSTNDASQSSILRAPLLILVAVGIGVVITFSGAFIYGQLAAALGAALAGTANVFAFRARESNDGIAASAGVITFALGSLVVLGHFYAELSTMNAALLFLSLAATAVPLPAWLNNRSPWQLGLVRATACLTPLAIALATATS